MKFLPLNTPIETVSRGETLTFSVKHVTEKAILIAKTSSRHGDNEIWLPKAALLAATRSGLVFENSGIAADRIGSCGVESFGYSYERITDAQSARLWAVTETARLGRVVSQDELDAQFAAPLKKKTATRHNIMTRAWQIASEAAARFGGSSRAFFAEALRMAWAEAR